MLRGAHSLKTCMVTGCVATLTPLFWHLAFSTQIPMQFFKIILKQFLPSLVLTTFFKKNFFKFCQKCVKICVLLRKLSKIIHFSPFDSFFLLTHWMNPFFGEKSPTERPLVSSCCQSTSVISNLTECCLPCYVSWFHIFFSKLYAYAKIIPMHLAGSCASSRLSEIFDRKLSIYQIRGLFQSFVYKLIG